mgnify:CR=1 FL=1
MKISIGTDHGGVELKGMIVGWLSARGHEVRDCGTQGAASVDYPDFGAAVGRDVASGRSERGIVICKSGIGMSIAANKIDGVRAALCMNTRMAELSRLHNNANVLVLGAMWCGDINIGELLDVWLSTGFEGGRHQARVDKITSLEKD